MGASEICKSPSIIVMMNIEQWDSVDNALNQPLDAFDTFRFVLSEDDSWDLAVFPKVMYIATFSYNRFLYFVLVWLWERFHHGF